MGIKQTRPDGSEAGGVSPAGAVVTETAFGQSPAVGASANYARADHTHGTPANPVPALNWTNATLLNSWINFGGAFQTVAYSKDAQGLVRLRGVIKDGAIGTVAFTLPTGFRPAATEIFAVDSANAFGRYSVAANGDVTIMTGNNAAFWLSGGSFSAA